MASLILCDSIVMPPMEVIEFGVEDIVRSGLCKEYLIAKAELNL